MLRSKFQLACVVDVLERHSRLHPGSKNVSDLKYFTLDWIFTFPQPKPKDYQSTTTSNKTTTILPKMHLMYTLDANGKRLYTLNKARGLSSYATFFFH